jgi:hypothetical protein
VTWTVLAGCIGLLSSGLLCSLLRLDRPVFVLAHGLVVAGFAAGYVRYAGIDVRRQVGRRWAVGSVGGLLFGLILVRGVLEQPASPVPRGGEMALALLWLGAVYGTADAVLLNVIPVLSIYGSRGAALARGFPTRLRWGLAALAGSLFVTACYHLGFAEYRNSSLRQPLIGNAIITTSYLLTGNPLAPVLAHVVMHGAAVLHGPATTHQLPPHYGFRSAGRFAGPAPARR